MLRFWDGDREVYFFGSRQIKCVGRCLLFGFVCEKVLVRVGFRVVNIFIRVNFELLVRGQRFVGFLIIFLVGFCGLGRVSCGVRGGRGRCLGFSGVQVGIRVFGCLEGVVWVFMWEREGFVFRGQCGCLEQGVGCCQCERMIRVFFVDVKMFGLETRVFRFENGSVRFRVWFYGGWALQFDQRVWGFLGIF